MKKAKFGKTGCIAYFILFFIGALSVQAQSTDSCFAKAPSEVAVGKAFKYTITTAERGEIISSDFGKFELVSGPSIGSSTSIMMTNGQMEQKTSYTYTYYLSCEKEGDFSIPGVTFSFDGRIAKTNFVIVHVSKAPKSQPQEEQQADNWFHFEMPQMPQMPSMDDFNWSWSWGGDNQQQQGSNNNGNAKKNEKVQIDDKIGKDDMFIKATAAQLEAFQGEAIVVTHKLYIKDNSNRYSIERAVFAQTDAFWANSLELDHREQTTETINGKSYTVYTIKQTAFYPTKIGKLTIPKLNLTLRIRVPATVRDPFWGTYNTYKNKDITLTSNDIAIKVKNLPNAKSAETEIVGNFTISSNLNKTETSVNKPIVLVVTISGTGNLHHISADDLNIDFPADCDVTYPRVSANISAKGNIVTGSKTFKYTIIPREEGTFYIPGATFNYYNYDAGAYRNISSPDYQIEVTPGNQQQSTPSDNENGEKKKPAAKSYKI